MCCHIIGVCMCLCSVRKCGAERSLKLLAMEHSSSHKLPSISDIDLCGLQDILIVKSQRTLSTDNLQSVCQASISECLLFLVRVAKYCDENVCLSVCVSLCSNNFKTALPNFTKFFAHVACGRGLVLLWCRCDTLCTSTLWMTSCCHSIKHDVVFMRSSSRGGRSASWTRATRPLAWQAVLLPRWPRSRDISWVRAC